MNDVVSEPYLLLFLLKIFEPKGIQSTEEYKISDHWWERVCRCDCAAGVAVTYSVCEHLHPERLVLWLLHMVTVEPQIYEPVEPQQHSLVVIRIFFLLFSKVKTLLPSTTAEACWSPQQATDCSGNYWTARQLGEIYFCIHCASPDGAKWIRRQLQRELQLRKR